MNLTKAQKLRLGVFVLTGTTIFVGAVLVLAGLKAWERRDEYTVRFKDSVSGLERSSQVRYQGLRVGRVERLAVAADDPSSIEVTISLERDTKLYPGTTAVLDMSGITGLKTINLTPGDSTKAVLEPGTRLPAGASLIDRITGNAEAITFKVEHVVNQLALLASDENRLRAERILDSISKLAADTDLFVAEARKPAVAALEETARTGAVLRVTAQDASKSMAELNQTLAAARGALLEAQRILKAVDDQKIAGTVDATKNAMNSLDARLSSAELGRTLSSLEQTLGKLSKLMQELDLAVRASREDFVTSMAHVRQATDDLREFSRIIAQDPSVLIRGKEAAE